jgi:S1-C subfamily serine protease
MREPGFVFRLIAVTAAAAILLAVWELLPTLRLAFADGGGEPRLVEARGDLAADEQATIALFEAARPSVVFISTAERVLDPWTRNAHDVPRGTGSGFVWDEAGHVVTNSHVIAGANSAQVRLADGTVVRAALVGVAPDSDLAVLRIPLDREPLRPLPIGASADLQVGQKVFAIGNPFGLDWTLTTGVVSALERELPGSNGITLQGLVQTDAAINPGNSGGPLLDSAGRLIGVNTAIYSPSGGSAGIGFAVPVDEVNRVVPQLIATGRYAPPTLGVQIDPQINEMAARQGLEGVLVLGVAPGSAADRAGLRPARIAPDGRIALGDVIVGVEGVRVSDVEAYREAMAAREAGETVEVTILRDGEELTLTAELDAG